MLDHIRIIATLVGLGLILVYVIRGALFCMQAFADDRAGRWITVGEILSAVAWGIMGIDALLVGVHYITPDAAGAVFWVVLGCKAASSVIKSDLGYKAVRDTYRGLHK